MLAAYRWLWLCVVATLLVLPISQATATPQNAPILTAIATFGHGAIRLSEWSPDGEMLAVYINDELRIYHNGSPDPLVIPYPEQINVMEFRQDNQMLAVADETGVKFWDTSSGEMFSKAEISGVQSFQFISDQPHVAIYQFYYVSDTLNAHLLIWDYVDNVEVHRLDFRGYPPQPRMLYAGDYVVASMETSQSGSGVNIATLYFYDTLTGERLFYHIDTRPYYDVLLLNPVNRDHAATLDERGIVRFWRISTGTELLALSLPYDLVRTIAFSPDGKQLATAGRDGVVRLWDAETGELLDIYPGYPYSVYKLKITQTGDIHAFSYPHGRAHVWDVKTGDFIAEYDVVSTSPLYDVSLDPQNQEIIGVTGSQFIRWDISSGEEKVSDCKKGQPCGGVISPDGTRIADFDSNLATVVVMCLQDESVEFVHHFDGDLIPRQLQWIPDGSGLLFTVSFDTSSLPASSQVLYLDLNSKEIKVLLEETITSMAYSPAEPLLVYSDESSFFWYQLESTAMSFDEIFDPWTTSLLFSPDGQFIVAVGESEIRVWNAETWQLRWERRLSWDHQYISTEVVIHPDNSMIFVAVNNQLLIFDAESGERLETIVAHEENISVMRFNADGTWFVTAGDDGFVKLWNVR